MKIIYYCFQLVLTIILQFATLNSYPCSMCKVTVNGRTYVGNNEDSWRMGSKIWFERGTPEKLGALYVGYENMFPQGGMNEEGLAFDGLTTYPKTIKIDSSKKIFQTQEILLKKSCKPAKQ